MDEEMKNYSKQQPLTEGQWPMTTVVMPLPEYISGNPRVFSRPDGAFATRISVWSLLACSYMSCAYC